MVIHMSVVRSQLERKLQMSFGICGNDLHQAHSRCFVVQHMPTLCHKAAWCQSPVGAAWRFQGITQTSIEDKASHGSRLTIGCANLAHWQRDTIKR